MLTESCACTFPSTCTGASGTVEKAPSALRRLFTFAARTHSHSLAQVLVAQLKAPSALRRQGAAGAIRNCCMSSEVECKLNERLFICSWYDLPRTLELLSMIDWYDLPRTLEFVRMIDWYELPRMINWCDLPRMIDWYDHPGRLIGMIYPG
jgi:hypothetical protein